MIELRDTVTIDASPQQVWRWLEAMPEHYNEWHPDHLGARWVCGGALAPGSVLEVHEVLHGRPHRLRMTVREVRPGESVRYRLAPGLTGQFDIRAVDGGARFTAVILVGIRAPVIGPLVDRLLRWTLGRRIEAIGLHQAEEGANLKALLEGRPGSPGAGRPGAG